MWVQRAALLAVGVVVLSAVHCSATGTVCGIPKCTVPGAKVRPHADTCGAGQREGVDCWSACLRFQLVYELSRDFLDLVLVRP